MRAVVRQPSTTSAPRHPRHPRHPCHPCHPCHPPTDPALAALRRAVDDVAERPTGSEVVVTLTSHGD
ncbi:hypothetical protein [Streptomyces turgidiscabies]|uniref:hypothetical protein n=1 Tax=Streptomyces turgidiscabies TaxID=85558 RepID=UPI0027D89145|nr:hypothetical protein [Streptomyces turgidiscabies]